MKKVFLLFGIAAFSSASAQQNDLFDIQKHLLKKQAEGKKVVEKNSMDLPFNKPFIYVDPYLKNNPVDSYTLPNGDKVVISKLDNMPCVQPDMRQFQIMPNLAYEGQFNFYPEIVLPDQIPNGSKPYSMIIPR